jgi:hypothetical protein
MIPVNIGLSELAARVTSDFQTATGDFPIVPDCALALAVGDS